MGSRGLAVARRLRGGLKVTERAWRPINTAPEGKLVMTKIDDADGVRNEQPLRRQGRLFFAPDGVYVYYTPTHWRELDRTEQP